MTLQGCRADLFIYDKFILMTTKSKEDSQSFPAPYKQSDLWRKFLEKIGIRRQKKLSKILDYLSKKTLRHSSGQARITNDEVEKLLHVSDSTATRYLDILEHEGKLKQVGKTGKYTHYELT